MKRREFLMSATTVPALARERTQDAPPAFQRDGRADIARLGVLTPDFDPVPESEIAAMAPPGVSIHGSRIRRTTRDPRSYTEPPHVDSATTLLAALKPRAILYAFTSSSYVLGEKGDVEFRRRLEGLAPGIPIALAADAACDALRAFGAKRVAVIHPPWFSDESNARGAAYFRSRGFDVLSCAQLAPARDFQEVPAQEVYDWVRSRVPERAEVALLAGNGMRSVGVIERLEAGLGRPVLTANQVTLWRALAHAGVSARPKAYGQLFERPVPGV